jgi:hypothetical protein
LPVVNIQSGGIEEVLAGVLAYGFLAAFVLSCVDRNRRTNRAGAPMLRMVGLGLMAGSFTMAGLLLALACFRAGWA